jgi:hypothetical protein
MILMVEDEPSEMKMPRVFRVMKKDSDGMPTVSQTSLGVRPGIDLDLDAQKNVLVNGKGMSVAPNWRNISRVRIPKRLRSIVPGAGGSNNTFCFRAGEGPFVQGTFASGITLEPDSPVHGNLAPAMVVPLGTYEADIAATRRDWQEDET